MIDIDTQPHRRPARTGLSERQQDRPEHAAAAAGALARGALGRLALSLCRRALDRHPRRREFFDALSACASRAGRLRSLRFSAAPRGGQRRNRSRMLLRSSSLGAGPRRLVLEAEAADAGAARVFLVVPLAVEVDHALRAPGLLHRNALQHRRHVVDPDRQRQAAAGLAVAELARLVVAHPDDRDDVRAGSRRTRRRSSRWWCRSCRRCRGA